MIYCETYYIWSLSRVTFFIWIFLVAAITIEISKHRGGELWQSTRKPKTLVYPGKRARLFRRWKSRIPSNVSGQVNYYETGKNVGRGDMEAQMCQAYTNIHKVLAEYGVTMKILPDIPILVIRIEKLSDNKSVLGWKQMKNWKSNSGAVMKSALLKA
jgi:hypothetical protein